MQPENSHPGDYLNQIATPPVKPGMNNRLFFVGIAGALLIIVGLVIFMISAGGSKGITTEQLALRLQSIQKVSEDSQKKIKDSQLRAINSRVITHLTNTNRDIAKPLEAAKIDLKKTSKSLSGDEEAYIDELNTKLEDARLNDEFDATYSREMAYELDTITIMMKALRKKVNSKSLREFIDGSYTSLSSIQKELQHYKPLY